MWGCGLNNVQMLMLNRPCVFVKQWISLVCHFVGSTGLTGSVHNSCLEKCQRGDDRSETQGKSPDGYFPSCSWCCMSPHIETCRSSWVWYQRLTDHVHRETFDHCSQCPALKVSCPNPRHVHSSSLRIDCSRTDKLGSSGHFKFHYMENQTSGREFPWLCNWTPPLSAVKGGGGWAQGWREEPSHHNRLDLFVSSSLSHLKWWRLFFPTGRVAEHWFYF